MDRLSEGERAVLELVALDELSVAEAAAAVGVRAVTARVRLHRARRILRAELRRRRPTEPSRGGPLVNRRPNRSEDFESRLLGHLKARVAERGAAAARDEAAGTAEVATAPPVWRRRGPRLALVGALALAGVVVALIVSAGGGDGSTAFAVEPQPGGGVTIKIFSLEDASGLEAALAEAGIRSQVNWLPAGMVCREPHYQPSVVHSRGGGSFGGGSIGGPGAITISVGSEGRSRSRLGEYRRGEISHQEFQAALAAAANVNLDPKEFGPDQSVVISGTPVPYGGDPEGGSITSLGVATGPVEPCDPVPAPPSGDGGGAFGLSPESGPGFIPQGDSTLSRADVDGDLHRAARAAEESGTQLEAPKPGQFLYTETQMTQLEGWLPKGDAKGSKAEPRYFVQINDPLARYALVPATKQEWMSLDGKSHVRETLGKIEFLSAADQRRWEAAGSPPPWEFDPAYHHVSPDAAGHLQKEFPGKTFRGRHEFTYMERVSQLPTEPEALRLRVENRPAGNSPFAASPATSLRGGGTVEKLLEILSEPLSGPALRAAAFDALAEIPDLRLERGVTDGAGRRGDAIGWSRERKASAAASSSIPTPRRSSLRAKCSSARRRRATARSPTARRSAKRHIWGRRSSTPSTGPARDRDEPPGLGRQDRRPRANAFSSTINKVVLSVSFRPPDSPCGSSTNET